MHDVIGCFLDLVNGEIKFTKNGDDLGVAFTLNPRQKSETYYPAVVLKNAEMSFNFGAQPFKHPPANDYVAVSSVSKESVKDNPVNSNQTRTNQSGKPTTNAPQAIIIEPSRELAEQTYNQIQKVRKNLAARVISVAYNVNIFSVQNAFEGPYDQRITCYWWCECERSNCYLKLWRGHSSWHSRTTRRSHTRRLSIVNALQVAYRSAVERNKIRFTSISIFL